jgi:hypothetical protein
MARRPSSLNSESMLPPLSYRAGPVFRPFPDPGATDFSTTRPAGPSPTIPTSSFLNRSRKISGIGKIPSRTHTSGKLVAYLLQEKHLWPTVTLVPACDLQARSFSKSMPGSLLDTRPATLPEVVDYVSRFLPPDMPLMEEDVILANEADVA